METLIASLLVWIAAETGLTAPPPRAISFVSHRELTTRHFGSRTPVSKKLRGIYDAKLATVYLPVTSHVNELRTQGVLLHELVHHVQRSNAVSLPCPEAYEKQAYELQLKWLREQQSSNPFEDLGVDDFTMFQVTACPDIDTKM